MTLRAFMTALFLIPSLSLSVQAAQTKFEVEPGHIAVQSCDPGVMLSPAERQKLFSKLRISKEGRKILAAYTRKYGSFSHLVIQWDSVSYSQVTSPVGISNRAPASARSLGTVVCVHLTRQLPFIEHVADLAHELTHATRLSMKVLRGEVPNVKAFVRARLSARGGESDAFAEECLVKRQILGHWDSFCAPYVNSKRTAIDQKLVVRDFYKGRLSASLTGEPYPVMLARQYRALLARRRLRKLLYSGLENKSASR